MQPNTTTTMLLHTTQFSFFAQHTQRNAFVRVPVSVIKIQIYFSHDFICVRFQIAGLNGMWSFPKSWPKFVPTSAWKTPFTMTTSPKPERLGGISVRLFPPRSIRTPLRPLCMVTLTPKVIHYCPLWYHTRTICIAELVGISRDRSGTTTKSSSKQYFSLHHHSSSCSSHRYYFAAYDGIRLCELF